MTVGQSGSRSPLPEVFGKVRVEEAFGAPFEPRRMAREFPDRAYVF